MAKILLVEDDNNLREIYGARLIAEGYEIVSAHDGEEALALAIKERPAMILTDVMMPKISGFDMVDILRSTTETKNIKVIIMTALSQPEDQKRGEQLGADRYLVKSQVTLEDVVRATHDVLGDKPASSAPAEPAMQAPQPVAPAPPAPEPAQQAQTPTPIATPPQPQAQVASQFIPPAPIAPSEPAVQAPQPVAPAPITPEPAQQAQTPTPIATPQPQSQGSNRTIQPLSDDSKAPSFQELVERELSKEADQPQTPEQSELPEADQPPTPPPAS